ncbi:Colicin-E7 immunity protein [compost metagenome]
MQGEAFEDYHDDLLKYFEFITEYPEKSDVLCYPEEGQEDSPEGVLKVVKEWRAQHGKPGFKTP